MYHSENIHNVSVLYRLPSCVFTDQALDEVDLIDTDELLIGQVINHYADTLKSDDHARQYLESRGIADDDAMKVFRLGFSDRSLGQHLQRLGKLEEDVFRGALQRIGMLKPSGHEFFCGSIVFPFIDEKGVITGGYGRRITPKLKARSVYHVHWLSDQTSFFNIQALSEYSDVILCKSPLEATTWWCNGFKNTVAIMGFFGFDNRHLLALKNSKVKQLYIAFGTTKEELLEARNIANQVASLGINSLFIVYPNGMDASAFALTVDNPKVELRDLLENSLMLASSLIFKHFRRAS